MKIKKQKIKREQRCGSFQYAILSALVTCGIGLAQTIEEAVEVSGLWKYLPGSRTGARFTYKAKSVLGCLAEKGCVVFVEREGKNYARITEKGRQVLRMERAQASILKKRKWDNRWRVVIFDIPEKKRGVRARLRNFMKEYGFIRLQNSVWVYPHDCEDFIALVKANLHIGADALYMIVEHIERDKYLREHFELPPQSNDKKERMRAT